MDGPNVFWKSLGDLPQGGLLVEWQALLGKGFDRYSRFFQPTDGRSQHYPCKNALPCRNPHHIRKGVRGRYVAVCEEPDEPCPSFTVSEKELVIWKLKESTLFDELRQVLKLEKPHGSEMKNGLMGWHGITSTRVPFFWVAAYDDHELADRLTAIKGGFGSGLVLLPTLSAFGSVPRGVVRDGRIEVVGCEGVLEIGEGGVLKALKSVEELVRPVLEWRGEAGSNIKVVREGVEALRKDVSVIRLNTQGVPSLVGEVKDARDNALGYVLEVNDEISSILTEPEHRIIWMEMRKAGGVQSAALPGIVAAGYPMSLGTLCRRVKTINGLLAKGGMPKCSVSGPAVRYKTARKSPDDQSEVVAPEPELKPEKWWFDEGERISTVEAYRKASAQDKAVMERDYANIKGMADGTWRKKMKSR